MLNAEGQNQRQQCILILPGPQGRELSLLPTCVPGQTVKHGTAKEDRLALANQKLTVATTPTRQLMNGKIKTIMRIR